MHGIADAEAIVLSGRASVSFGRRIWLYASHPLRADFVKNRSVLTSVTSPVGIAQQGMVITVRTRRRTCAKYSAEEASRASCDMTSVRGVAGYQLP